MSPLKVLLIEDDDNHAMIISRYLSNFQEEAIYIRRTARLQDGLDLLDSDCFHVLLLDLSLPDSSIDDTLNTALKKAASIPIVILSSIEDQNLARKLIHQGAQDYICKTELSTEILIRSIYGSIERKKIEDALKQSELRNSKIIESSLDGIISMDQSGTIIEFNPAAEKMFGLLREHVLNKANVEAFIPPKYRSEFNEGLEQLLKTGDSPILNQRFEKTALRSDNSEFPIEVSLVAQKLNFQHTFTAFIRDITEQKKIAADLNTAREVAEVANRAKSAFLANMSHEIRTPLGAVIGYSELLATGNLKDNEKARFIEAIKRNGEILSKLINDILDLSKVEAGKIELEQTPIFLTDILSEIKSTLKFFATEKDVRLDFIEVGSVPFAICTDKLRLRQILFNIIGNAIKFTEKGFVEVKVSSGSTSDAKTTVYFAIKDSGKGISKENTARLFSPFSQADSSTTRQFGGTGLGLILSKRLARLLGGDVELTESKVGVGSTFLVSIDAGIERLAHMEKPVSVKNQRTNPSQYRLDGMTVLLAEDSPDNQLIVSRILQQAGAKVDIVNNGKEAIDKVHQQKYNLIVMDLQMPIMDGYGATSILRSEGNLIPIVALTAHALSEEKQKCLQSGFTDHISKPVERQSLLASLARFAKKLS